jgi:hypothetical protein
MRSRMRVVTAIVVVLGLILAAGTVLFAHGWGTDPDGKVDTLTGTVSFKRPGGFFLKTDDAEEYKLGLGPIWYLDNLGLELRQGDRIEVTGYTEEDDFILVTSVEKNGETYVLADSQDFEDSYYGHGHMMGGSMMHGYAPRGYRGRRADHPMWNGNRGWSRSDHPMWRGNRGWFGGGGGPCW